MANLDLADLATLALEGGYSGLISLDNFSAVMILSSASAFLDNRNNWRVLGQYPDDTDWDTINELVADMEYQIMTAAIGVIVPSVTTDIPLGMLLCDGAIYARVDYPELYAVIDSAFIIDADNFAVPDLQNRFPGGADGFAAVGDTGGKGTHTITVAQLPSHSHGTVPHSHSYSAASIGASLEGAGVPIPAPVLPPGGYSTAPASPNTTATGGGDPIPTIPPFLAVNYVIVAGR